jgi:hypothetical protein
VIAFSENITKQLEGNLGEVHFNGHPYASVER